MIKSVYFFSYHKKRLYTLPEERAKLNQKRAEGRIVPKKEALEILRREKLVQEEITKTRMEDQFESDEAMPLEDVEELMDPKDPIEAKEEDDKEELLSLLIGSGTVELKGSWYKYQGSNYRKSEILELI